MHKKAFSCLLAWVTLLCTGAALGRSQGSESSPEAVAGAFLAAAIDYDQKGVLPLLTKKARESFSFEMWGKGGAQFSIDSVSIQGETAEAAASVVTPVRTEHWAVLMKSEDRLWRVCGLRKGPLTIDFETSQPTLEAFAQSFGQHLKNAFDEAFTNPAEDPSSLDLKEAFTKRYENPDGLSAMTALDALGHLSKGMGLRVDAAIHADELRMASPIDVKGVQRLEAIEQIARQFGLHPVYPSPESVEKLQQQGTAERQREALQQPGSGIVTIRWQKDPLEGAITFVRGPRLYPASFAGPFLISLEKVEEHVPYATGRVRLEVRAYGLEPLVSRLFGQLKESIEIYSVEDERGGNLMKEPNLRYAGGLSQEGTAYQWACNIDLAHLLKDVEQIALIKGAQPLLLPTEIVAVEFSDLNAGSEQRSGDLSVTVTSAGQKTEFEIKGPAERLKHLFVDFDAKDSQGDSLNIEDRSQIRQHESVLWARLATSAIPSSIVLKLVSTAIVKYPFELRQIALKRHADMPEELAPLSFQGEAPLGVEFVSFGDDDSRNKALLRLHNRSNKDVLSVQVEWIASNSQGVELERSSQTLGPVGFEGAERLVGAGATAKREEWLFLPPETAQLQFQVEGVEFMDGTRWDRP